MIIDKPLVSLIVAFAVASGVAASSSVAPVRKDVSDFPPPTVEPIPIRWCNTGSLWCCDIYTSTSNPAVAQSSGLLGAGAVPNPDLIVGLRCLPFQPLSAAIW